jgi:hypothetical protein
VLYETYFAASHLYFRVSKCGCDSPDPCRNFSFISKRNLLFVPFALNYLIAFIDLSLSLIQAGDFFTRRRMTIKISVFWDIAPSNQEDIDQITQRNIPEDNYLHIRRRENLKSHINDC